jgi:hypothetical protein
MRGQYLTIEYVLFFAFGVAMTVAIFYAFSGIAGSIHDTSMNSQLERTGEALRDSAITVFESAAYTKSEITYNVSVPLKLSACTYAVLVSGRNLNLNCTDNYKLGAVLDLYGLPVQDTDVIYSSRGYIEIKASATSVVLD